MNKRKTIFNQKLLIKKYKNAVKLDHPSIEPRRKVLEKWINMLESGRLEKMKEEQLQGEFVGDIFSKVLRCVYLEDGKVEEWNLQREITTKVDGTKADGVIGFFTNNGEDDIRALIELKGPKINLDMKQKSRASNQSAVEQAFGYHHKYGKKCKWIIVSNFKEIRLYSASDSTEFECFYLEDLKNDDEFQRFLYLLSFNSIIKKSEKSIVDKLWEDNIKEQIKIENDFYKKYHKTRLDVFNHIKERNSSVDINIILTKTQKLMDRFIFICFAEDKGLLPENVFRSIVERGKNGYSGVWVEFKGFCGAINNGNPKRNINKFNGGLFSIDSVLDSLTIDDDIFEELVEIADYDFDSELNENILGHIFEQSISDLEELKAEINGESFDKKTGKRKKDGVFYTPKYITKYIVENAISSWLEERKKELGFDSLPELTDEDFKIKSYLRGKQKGSKNYSKNYIKHIEFWREYRKIVNEIKILDPACGSGAFLIEAFQFLQKIKLFINEQLGYLAVEYSDLPDERITLQKNLYGVDINSESVEITKLALWLKTANKGKELTTLDNNIKCGNSLIDDEEVAGEKAFKWSVEFKDVIESEGFDIIIGNPPYIFAREKISNIEKNYYSKYYKSANYQINTYLLFIEKTIDLAKKKAHFGLIVPNAWLMVYSGKGLRKYLLEKCKLQQIINLEGYSFDGINVETIIILSEKQECENNKFQVLLSKGKEFIYSHSRNQNDFSKNKGLEFRVFLDEESMLLINKMCNNSVELDSIVQIKSGLKAYERGKGNPRQSKEDVKNRPYDYSYKYDENTYKYLDGKNVGRYFLNWSGSYLKYGEHLAASRSFNLFSDEKIIVREITGKYPRSIISTFSNEIYLYNMSNIAILKNKDKNISLKYIIAILNSTLMSYYFMKNTAKSVRKMFPKIILKDLRLFPFKEIDNEYQKSFIEKVDHILRLFENLLKEKENFINTLKEEKNLLRVSKKLEVFYELDFDNLKKELKKQKINFKLGDENNSWREYFYSSQQNINSILSQIDKTDKEIDLMVYKLYELSKEDMNIIENLARKLEIK